MIHQYLINRVYLVSFSILLAAELTGCNHSLNYPQYIIYLSDPANGLTHTKETNGTVVTCTYQPTALFVNRELRSTINTSNEIKRDSLYNVYDGKLYCTLTFSHNGAELEQGFTGNNNYSNNIIDYLNNGITQDTYLHLPSSDSIAAAGATYARYYGNAGHSTVLLVFNITKTSTDKGFIIKYNGARLGLSTLQFIFKPKALQNLPKLL